VGVIGHRSLDCVGVCTFVYSCCYGILDAIQGVCGGVIATSATAAGADTLFGEAALALGIPIETVTPFRGYESDFPDPEPSARYQRLQRRAVKDVNVRFDERHQKAYRKAMQWIVIRSDLVIAVWDGARKGSVGGTWEAVELARALSFPVVHVNPVARETRLCVPGDQERSVSPRDIGLAVRDREAAYG